MSENTEKKYFKLVILIVIFILCIWRFWPRTIEKIIPMELNSIRTISLQMTEFGTVNHDLKMDVYSLDKEISSDEESDVVLAVLDSTKYFSDFRNLLPWDVTSVGSGAKSITHSVIIKCTGSNPDETYYINFHGDRTVSIHSKYDSEFRIYHPVKRQTLYRLADYIKQNGTLE